MLGLLAKSRELVFPVALNLLWIDHGVTCLLPGLHAPCEASHVLVAHCHVFCCLTGSSFFITSASVENNLLILFKRGKFRLKLI